MFSVGQKVWHRNGQRSGTVLELDDDRVYIVQDNGAELDFAASELTATPPVVGQTSAEKLQNRVAAGSSYKAIAPPLTAGDITPEHLKVLAIVPPRTLRAVADIFQRRAGAQRFGSLGAADKLNVITDVTAISYRTMQEYKDRPGELGLLMGKGLAARSI